MGGEGRKVETSHPSIPAYAPGPYGVIISFERKVETPHPSIPAYAADPYGVIISFEVSY